MARVVSGMRATGPLHIGHYFGTLVNWLQLQEEHECYFFIADLHALTTDYGDAARLRENVKVLFAEWLAAGLDPQRSVLFLQSQVPEHAELALLLGMLIPLSWLERNPTYKEQLRELKNRELRTFGFLGYPVLMAADIFLYEGELVPVGEDQLPHLELTREFARRFNQFYGDVLVEPQALLTPARRVPGMDRRKMSKSYGNAIYLGDSPQTMAQKVHSAYTDPQKIRKHDPGHPEGCVVFAYHQLVQEESGWKQVERECRAGERGCVDCKAEAARLLAARFAEFRERRAYWLSHETELWDLLLEGCRRARRVAQQTMQKVRAAMGLTPEKALRT